MKIVKSSMIYLLSSVLNKGIPFLLLPVFTNYMSPSEYGKLSMFTIMVTIYGAFIGMALNTNVSKNFFSVSKEKLALINGNMLIILFSTFTLFFSLTFLYFLFFESFFSIPSGWMLIVPLISMMIMVNEINTTIIRCQENPLLFGIFEISNTAVKMLVTLILLVTFYLGWKSQAYGFLTSSIIFFFVGIVFMYRQKLINFKYDKNVRNEVLKVSVPLIPHVLGAVVISLSDRIFIERFVGIEEVGIYSVGYTFGMIIMIATDAFIKAWSPWFFKTIVNANQKTKLKIVKYTYLYIIFLILMSIIISFFGSILLKYYINSEYQNATNYIFWISLSYAFHGIYKIFFPYLVHINKTSFLAFSTVIAAILNITMNYFFIKYFGAIGGAYSTIISFMITSTLVFLYQKRHFDMPWNLKINE